MSDEPLTTGWEGHVPSDDSVLLGAVRAQADRAARTVGGAAGARVWRDDRVVAAEKGSPFYFENLAVLVRPPIGDEVHEVVAELRQWFPPGLGWVLLSPWPIDDLRRHGLTLMGHPPMMFRPAGGEPPSAPPTLRIERVADIDGIADYVHTMVDAFPTPELAGVDPAHVFPPGELDETMQLFVGYEDDRPVATALSCIGHGMNWIEWVSTRDDCRGKGYGAAVTWAATLADPSLPAGLIASDLGQPVYARMGYLRMVRWTLWFDPGAG